MNKSKNKVLNGLLGAAVVIALLIAGPERVARAAASTDGACTGTSAQCPSQVLQLLSSYDKKLEKDAWPGADDIIDNANKRAQKLVMAGNVLDIGRDTYRTELGGKTHYLTANVYFPLTKSDITEIEHTSTKIYPGFCAFYIYDENKQYESSYVATMGNGRSGTHCNSVIGVSGVTFQGKPALMAVVQFIYMNGKAAGSIGAIGGNYVRTIVLLPLVQQPDGKWIYTQDTSCFAPTNTIADLAKAKAHLKTCH